MKIVKDILAEKGSCVVTIREDQTIEEALALLVNVGIGALVVVNSANKVAGIFSERDCIRNLVIRKETVLGLQMKDVMSYPVLYVDPERTVDECMSLVTEKRCRHLPVMVDDKLVGLVSIGDLVKATISEKEFLIQQLTHYIQSGG
ncbi:MAG: CBS domain-containing protein [Desulfuromonadales bacterium]|nr:CBS domain-containing protein [Desulfuromonadales bacterium]